MVASSPPPAKGSDLNATLAAPAGAGGDAIRKAKEVARWRRRSLTIRFWRGFLPVAIGAIVIGLLGWVGVKSYQSFIQAPAKGGDIRMLRPQFFGRNAKNQPYTLTADEAVRDPHNAQLVALTQPRLTLQSEAPAPVKAQSERGLLNEDTHILWLNGSVVVLDGRGYTYRSDTARIDTMTHDAGADSHVVGDGPMGHFEADRYRLDQKNGHALLTGHVHTHLLPQGSPAAKP